MDAEFDWRCPRQHLDWPEKVVWIVFGFEVGWLLMFVMEMTEWWI